MKKPTLYLILGVLIGASSILGFKNLRSYFKRINAEQVHLAHQKWVNQAQSDDFKLSEFKTRLSVSEDELLLQYLNLKRNGHAVACKSINEERWNEFFQLYDRWPKGIKDYCQRHVARIHVVSGLGASGYVLQQTEGRFVIVLDSSAIEKRPNQWFTAKESSILELEGSGYSINHRLEADSNDQPAFTIETLMLHEIGHCIGVSAGQTFNFDIQSQPILAHTLQNGVFLMETASVTMSQELHSSFGGLQYYRDKRISIEDYMRRLRALPLSPFPTMYSTVSDQEFFADYFYAYVHCIVQKRPLSYTVSFEGEQQLQINCGVSQPHHAARRAILANILLSMESEPESILKEFQ